MNPFLRISLACFGISLVVTYLWWVKIRVWRLRQDLFVIRDELWDAMRIDGSFSDPEYREFREGMNAVIRLAPVLSILTVIGIVLNRDEFRPFGSHIARKAPIAKARALAFSRITTYLLFETLTGLVIVGLALVFGLSMAFKKALSRRIEWLIDSRELQALNL
jgi:hypothetical protein